MSVEVFLSVLLISTFDSMVGAVKLDCSLLHSVFGSVWKKSKQIITAYYGIINFNEHLNLIISGLLVILLNKYASDVT